MNEGMKEGTGNFGRYKRGHSGIRFNLKCHFGDTKGDILVFDLIKCPFAPQISRHRATKNLQEDAESRGVLDRISASLGDLLFKIRRLSWQWG